MLDDFIHITLLAAAIIALLLIVERLRWKLGLPDEAARKTVHVGTGILVFFAPPFFPRAGAVVAISALFVGLNVLAYWRGWLKAVHHTARPSFGTVYYPLALLALAALAWDTYPDLVVASILVMALGDSAAGLVGENIAHPSTYTVTSDPKSAQGSTAMFAGSLLALLLTMAVYGGGGLALGDAMRDWPLSTMLAIISIALFASAWEAASSRGLDNLTVPLSTAAALHLCFAVPLPGGALLFATGSALGLLIAVSAHRLRMLQAGGAIATYLLAVLVFGSGGWQWTMPIFTFFLLSSLLSKWGKRRKRRFDAVFEKGGTRDAGQVAANGAIVGVLALSAHFFPHPAWYLASLGAVAAVTADTWGTELGILSKHRPVSILSFRSVEAGTSGGVTIAGTLAGAAGALLIGTVGWLFLDASPWIIAAAGGAGIAGSSIDSLLGATLQAQYRCRRCGRQTERRVHCGQPAELLRGFRWMTNDTVNLLAALTGALIILLL